jgi:hypothetical protein
VTAVIIVREAEGSRVEQVIAVLGDRVKVIVP